MTSIDGEVADLDILTDLELAAPAGIAKCFDAVMFGRRLRNSAIVRELRSDTQAMHKYADGPGAAAVARWKAHFGDVGAPVVAAQT